LTTGRVTIPPRTEVEANILHAAGNGAAIGLKIGGLICGNIISLLSLLAAVDAGLTWVGKFITIEALTLELVTGYILVPVSAHQMSNESMVMPWNLILFTSSRSLG
jgi:CNT family concentrative nucleoside transporter